MNFKGETKSTNSYTSKLMRVHVRCASEQAESNNMEKKKTAHDITELSVLLFKAACENRDKMCL